MLVNNLMQIDESTIQSGYIVITTTTEKIDKRIKIGVKKDEWSIYYDLIDKKIQIPLQFGAGKYKITMYKNVIGKKYSTEGTITIDASNMSPIAYQLHPNQYVQCDKINYKIDDNLTARQKLKAIRAYIKENYFYDYVREYTIPKGALPNIVHCFETKSGICQDLAALAVAILRNNGVPARLIIGYTDKAYHAWVGVTIGDTEYRYDPTLDCQHGKLPKYYKKERWY